MIKNKLGSDMFCSCCGRVAHAVGEMGASRRRFISTGLASAAALTAGGAILPKRALAQTTISPDAALQKLIDGNGRFVGQKMTSFDEDLLILKQGTAGKQEPFAAVLACADSRVPVEIIFDQSIGQLFVARVAGNIATSEIIASLEFGTEFLGAKTILVLGHSRCGAVEAAMTNAVVPGQISALYAPLRQAVDRFHDNAELAIKANAKIQANILATASPVLAGLIRDGKLKIEAGYYSLDTGQVTLL